MRPVWNNPSVNDFDYPCVKDKTVYGVYHVFCVNAWKSLVRMQLQKLWDTGLMDKTDKLFVSCIYNHERESEELDAIINEFPVQHEIISALPMSENQFEFPALEFIRGLSQKEDFYVYYFHTKGVSYTKESVAHYPSASLEQLDRCSRAWREMMEHFIFAKHDVAINALKEYDAYGCKYDDPVVPPHHYKYYAGNFWWSKSWYIRTLPRISEEEKKNRYLAENWLLLYTDKMFSAFNTPAELYAVEIPRCVYVKKDIRGGYYEYIRFVVRYYFYLMKKLWTKIRNHE